MTMLIKRIGLALLIGLAGLFCACSVAVPVAQVDESGQYGEYKLPYGAGTLRLPVDSQVVFQSNGKELIASVAIKEDGVRRGTAFIHINPLDYDEMFNGFMLELTGGTNFNLDELLDIIEYVPGVYPSTYNDMFTAVAKVLDCEPEAVKKLILQMIADENYVQDYYTGYELIKVNFNGYEEYITRLMYRPGGISSRPDNEPEYYWVYKVLYCGRDYKLLISGRISLKDSVEEEFFKFLTYFKLN